MPISPDLTVTIVSWNTRDLLRACLQSLQQSKTRSRVEVHVVDNASHDGSFEMVRAEFPDALLILNSQNLGFAAANNQSWQQSSGRYWMLLNSDTEVKPGALDALIAFMDAHQRAGLATARLLNIDGTPQHCAQPNPSILRILFEASRLHKLLPDALRGQTMLGPYCSYKAPIQVGWTWGTALIARREAVEDVGPLSEDFFMYGEDLEWSLRMRRNGWEIWFCPEAEVLHYGGQSSAQKWNDAGKLQIILNNIYKAIELNRGRVYVSALQAATLGALGIEWLACRIRGRDVSGPLSSISCHWRILKGALSSPLLKDSAVS